MGFYFGNVNISGGSASGYDMANKSLSNLDAAGNAKFTAKQNVLVSGTNIKTVNGVSLLGSGDVVIGEGGTIAIDQTYNSTSTNAQSGTAVAESLLTVANKDLSNLSSTGQMIVDSQNGTISNCILEIPQNIKLEISGNTVTLKSGSTVVITGDTYRTVTTTNDRSGTFNSDGKYYLMMVAGNSSIANWFNFNDTGSGSTLPADGSTYKRFFLTTDKKIYLWNNQNSSWAVWNNDACYPLGIIVVSNGVVSFAKDSNGNDMIFNGAGFIGHHAFVYPNVKGLKPNGFNEDGSLASNEWTNSSLQIVELQNFAHNIMFRVTGVVARNYYQNIADAPDDNTSVQTAYDPNNNQMYYRANGTLNWASEKGNYINLIDYTYNGTTVTDFTISQPVRTATTEMLDKKQDTLTFDTIPTSASTNPVTSGGVYTALSGKQADITTITGYDATKTQTLKNVSGVLTWVDDGE